MMQRTAPLKHGTRVAAVMTATALMMTAAVTGLTLVESRTQATTMAADTAIIPSATVADLAAADIQYSAAGLPELPSLAAISATADASTPTAAQSSAVVARPAAQPVAQVADQPAAQVTESDDHQSESGDHEEQDD